MLNFRTLCIYMGFPSSSAGKESACNAGSLGSIPGSGRSSGEGIGWRRDRPRPVFLGFPGGSDGKVSTCNAGDLGLIPGIGVYPGGGRGNPLQCSCLENPMDRERSLAGYSPWDHKESDMTE